jgi:hypothetical protein
MPPEDIYRQKRRPIVPKDLDDQDEQGFGSGIDAENPMANVEAIQSQVARELGRESAMPMMNPDGPMFTGNIPPEFLQKLGKSSADFQVPEGQPKRKNPPRHMPTSAEAQGASQMSDAFTSLMERLESHIVWEEIELPSLGKFYDNIPAVIHVRPMTGQEEQILATTRHVKRGKAVDMIFEKCVREFSNGRIRPEELLGADRTYLLIFLRGISYTPEYDVEIRCPNCSQTFTHTINLDQLEAETCPDEFGPDSLSGTLPTSGFRFRYRLATGQDEMQVTNYREARIREFGQHADDDSHIYRMQLLLEEIEGVSDKKELSHLIRRLPVNDVVELRNVINDIPFGVKTEVGIMCEFCTFSFETEMPYEANFFFPRKRKDSIHQ